MKKRAYDYMTEEEIELKRSYSRKIQRFRGKYEVTEAERLAQNKHRRILLDLKAGRDPAWRNRKLSDLITDEDRDLVRSFARKRREGREDEITADERAAYERGKRVMEMLRATANVEDLTK